MKLANPVFTELEDVVLDEPLDRAGTAFVAVEDTTVWLWLVTAREVWTLVVPRGGMAGFGKEQLAATLAVNPTSGSFKKSRIGKRPGLGAEVVTARGKLS
jgi:hypothetical protein